MNEQQLAELKRIKGILSAVTGLEDDDQEYIEDARKALQSIISQDALDWMAKNARELGLDYEPAPAQEGRDWSLLEATQESLREHMAEIKRLQNEIIEQCRINGMSAEREDALRAEIKRLKAAQLGVKEG
jgi:multidrug efflux pump subunit AcrB